MPVNKMLEQEIQEKAAKIIWVKNLSSGRIARANPCLARMVAKGRDGLVACNPTDEELVANGYEVPKTRKKAAPAKAAPAKADSKPRRARKVVEPEAEHSGTQTGTKAPILQPDPIDEQPSA